MKQIFFVFVVMVLMVSFVFVQIYVVINGCVVMNMNVGIIENGIVLLRDGDIVVVGVEVVIFVDVIVIDVDGGWIMFGIFVFYMQLGLIEVVLEVLINDVGVDDSDFFVVLDVVDSFNLAGIYIFSM